MSRLHVMALRRLITNQSARRALQALPNYALKEIGISRSEIDWVVIESRRRNEHPL